MSDKFTHTPDANINVQREPPLDIIEDDNSISITIELPGVEKENIELIVDKNLLTLSTTEATRKYHKELRLSSEVDPDTAEATYRNGVLDIVLKKVKKAKTKEPKEILIEIESKFKHLVEEKDNIITSLQTQLDGKTKLAEDYLNKLQRIQSDFQNYKQRIAKEKEQDIEKAKEELILKTLEVLDNFDRALEAGKQTRGKNALLKGIEMIHKQLQDVLKFECVEPIDTVGKKFDPELHEIMFKEFTDNKPEDTIIEEFQKGYTFKSKIIRPAKVKVIKPKSEEKKEK
jgi:molecular chaperone GrpE